MNKREQIVSTVSAGCFCFCCCSADALNLVKRHSASAILYSLCLFCFIWSMRNEKLSILPSSTQLPSLNLNVSFFDTSIDWRKFTRLIKFIYIENVFWKWYGKYCSHSHHLWRITLLIVKAFGFEYVVGMLSLTLSLTHTSSLFYVSLSALF